MTVLITMAGLGSRFREKGYLPPKFRIRARGRTLMDWSLLSLQAFFGERFVFACLDDEDGEWIRSTAEGLGIADAVLVKRSGLSRGQAETAFDALTLADPRQPLWIYNIDTCVAPDAMRPEDLGNAAGCVPVFHCTERNMSFVRYGADGDVTEIAEKELISSWATVGLYGFRTAACFAKYYQQAYDGERAQVAQGERYVAPIYGLMITQGERIVAPRLKGDEVNILGTPAQVLSFDPEALPPFGSAAQSSVDTGSNARRR
jgi:NDP-sugar pyrophosphorylase family protein